MVGPRRRPGNVLRLGSEIGQAKSNMGKEGSSLEDPNKKGQIVSAKREKDCSLNVR